MDNLEIVNQKYLVLNVKEGVGFGFVKNLYLRIAAKFNNKFLISDPVYPVPQPDFKCSFVWSLDRLSQKTCSFIRIEVVTFNSQRNSIIGCTQIGLKRAHTGTWVDTLPYHCLPLRNVKTKFGVRIPEIFVTLSIQQGPALRTYPNVFSKDIIVNHPQLHVKFTTNQNDATVPKIPHAPLATPNSSISEDQDNEKTPFHHYMLEMNFGSVEWYSSLKNTKVSIKVFNPRDKSIKTAINSEDIYHLNLLIPRVTCRIYYGCIPGNLINMLSNYPPCIMIFKANDNTRIAKGATRIHPWKDEDMTSKLKTSAPFTKKNKETIGSVTIFLTIQDLGVLSSRNDVNAMECFIKDNSIRDDLKDDLEKLSEIGSKLEDTKNKLEEGFKKITCRQISVIAHISEHEKLIKRSELKQQAKEAVIHTRPIWKEGNANNSSGTEHPQQHSYVDADIITHRKPKYIKETGKTVSFCISPTLNKNKNQNTSDTLVQTGSKKKITTKKKSQHNIKESDNNFKPSVKNKSPYRYYETTAPVEVPQRRCKGCLRELQNAFEDNVWQNDEQQFWCKDCAIKNYQTELTQLLQQGTVEISDLQKQINRLEDEYKEHTANTVSKEKYEYLSAAQHNLTMLLLQAQEQNNELHMKCLEAVEELGKLKQVSPMYNFSEIYNTTLELEEEIKQYLTSNRAQELKQVIEQYKRENDLIIKIDDDEKDQPSTSHTQLKTCEMKIQSVKDRCEACKIIRERKSAVSKTASHPYKSVNKAQSQQTSGDAKMKKSKSVCINELRNRMDTIHAKLQKYLNERDDLIRVYRYTCGNPAVVYMTHIIQHLLGEWFELKVEFENAIKG